MEGRARKRECRLSNERSAFPVSATRGQNCGTNNSEMFPEMEKLNGKFGI
jgi:hypothetical protein